MEKEKKKSITGTGRLADRFSTFLFYASIILFLTAFNFRDNPGGWQLQIIPNLNGTTIQDVTFTDSLTGYLATGLNNQLGYIFKTTNGGVNWVIKKTNSYNFQRIIFCGKDTGYCNSYDTLFKTTNAGENWFSIPFPFLTFADDMCALNKDTLWFVMSGMFGGIFRSTNGGYNWINQYIEATHYPDKIYMVNKNLGFIRDGFSGSYIGRTTNGGFNWSLTNVDSSFYDMHFYDSLNGWMAGIVVKNTTDGGLNWTYQSLPNVVGSIYNVRAMLNFSLINKDTAFGVGGWFDYPNNQTRGIVYKTTNGGINWGYQIPDTTFGMTQLHIINFIDKLKGSAYKRNGYSIRTVSGGSDTTFYTAINNHETILSLDFALFQNYPNPFNQSTVIKYEIKKSGYVTMKVYDITGKEIRILTDGIKPSGNYEIRFDAGGLASGIYFYKLSVISQGKEQSAINKMILVK